MIINKEFIKEPVFQQFFYCTNYSGIKAAKAVVMFHKEMEQEARKRDIDLLISSGSHTDNRNVFVRILAGQGWKIRGYVATLRLSAARAG